MQALANPHSDLAEILAATERRVVEFDLARVDVSQLTLLEMLDICDAVGVDPEQLTALLENDNPKRARLFYAIAWVILRRIERTLTYDDVCEFDLLVTGEPMPTGEAVTRRAKALVAVATISGTAPQVAGQMTMAEVAEYTELAERRNRAMRRSASTRPRRRKA